jgi:putative ABC transport system permease protein
MNWWRRLRAGDRLDVDLDRELRDHLDRLVDDKKRGGMQEDDARRQAHLEFGGLEQVKEHCRDARGTVWVEAAVQDVRVTLRMLGKTPGFALAAICTLALGIGANTAICTVVYQVLLKPLPYAMADELVSIQSIVPQTKFQSMGVTAPDFEVFRQSNSSFVDMAAVREVTFNLSETGEPERVHGARVSADLFSLLGVQPAQGRAFLAAEDAEGRDRVVVISHRLWVRKFGAARDILGRPIVLDREPYEVIGLMPEGWLFPSGRQLHPLAGASVLIDIWKPMAFTKNELTSEGSFDYAAIGRLKPGIIVDRARQDLDAAAQINVERIKKLVPGIDYDLRMRLVPLREVFSGDARRSLLMLGGAVGLLLLIACVNLANLLLARTSNRAREIATRAALGAPRARLIRQLLTESVVIAAAGSTAGLLVALAATPLLMALRPAALSHVEAFRFSLPVLLFTMVTALMTGVVFGLPPALHCAQRDLHEHLRDNVRGMTSGRRPRRLRLLLVTVEVALCTGLLMMASLLLRSFVNVMRVDAGFGVEHVHAVDVALPREHYQRPQIVEFYRALVENVGSLPGVSSTAAVNVLPMMHEGNITALLLESDTMTRIDRPAALYRRVTPGYFETLGIPLVAGRALREQEPEPVVVLSTSLAQLLYPGESPSTVVGKRVRQSELKNPLLTIVGVVGDIRPAALDRDTAPAFYRPMMQTPALEMTLVIRTGQDPRALASGVRAEVRKLDATLAIPPMRSLAEIVSDSVSPRRFQMTLTALFAALALALALVGIYGVTSYTVARQTPEIGVRIALGADRRALLETVMVQGMAPVVVGLAIGLAAGGAAALSVRSVLFGIGPLDPVALAGVSAVLLLTATIACYVPARRAASTDPAMTLRAE